MKAVLRRDSARGKFCSATSDDQIADPPPDAPPERRRRGEPLSSPRTRRQAPGRLPCRVAAQDSATDRFTRPRCSTRARRRAPRGAGTAVSMLRPADARVRGCIVWRRSSAGMRPTSAPGASCAMAGTPARPGGGLARARPRAGGRWGGSSQNRGLAEEDEPDHVVPAVGRNTPGEGRKRLL